MSNRGVSAPVPDAKTSEHNTQLTAEIARLASSRIPRRIDAMMAADPWRNSSHLRSCCHDGARCGHRCLILTGRGGPAGRARAGAIMEAGLGRRKQGRDGRVVAEVNHRFVQEKMGVPGNYAKLPTADNDAGRMCWTMIGDWLAPPTGR